MNFGVVGVEVVVVDVELRVGVGLAGGLEGDGHEVLAEDVGEDAGPEGPVPVEDLTEMLMS